MIRSFLFCLSLLLIKSAFSQEAQSTFGKDFLPVWESTTNNALEVAKAMPEKLYDYKPNDSSRTFKEQMVHIALGTSGLSHRFINPDGDADDVNSDPAQMDKAEVISLMEACFDKATEAITRMTDEQAKEVITVFGGKEVPRFLAVIFVLDHLTNHRAKANLYIRMNDIKPPSYGFF